ncbi:MAG: ammonium transporter [Oscillospiraceae bacterium]|nr:ammonium transporter [Oscillospiraceae bacterium]
MGELIFGSTGVWFMMGAALVFFMQAGFAMVESGFTRAKNAGNIIMKNLMDFCVGTVVFVFLGAGLLLGEDALFGLIGIPNLGLFKDFGGYDWGNFVFNLVFCATAATIVSGAMAERTKFSSYLIYSAVISAVVYPIEAHWVWGGGWLTRLGANLFGEGAPEYVDFAGSSAIHMVGGLSALIGAIILGPRIGKYVKNKDGSVKVNAIPGHSITLGALGVFILWFGWYGFNGAAAADSTSLAQIFGTTTLAAGVATCSTMIFTWVKNGKPDVSMTLNGSLAGLVAITAGCANVDALGAIIIGLISGILVVVAVEVIDLKFHIDDPVGAVAVHCVNGMFGTIAVGLFDYNDGVFYGGGFKLLAIQTIGVLAIALWTVVTMTITFKIIEKTNGLRVSKEEEIKGLDSTEHGLINAYADFACAVEHLYDGDEEAAEITGSVSVDEAVPVQLASAPAPNTAVASDVKMTKIEIICKQNRFEALKNAMTGIGITGMTVTNVLGFGTQGGSKERYRGVEVEVSLLPKIQVEIVVCKVPVKTVIDTAKKVLYTGNIGDGKIFVYDVENVIKVRTGEEGYDALQDVE